MSENKSEWSVFLEALRTKGLIAQEHIDKERLDFIGQRIRIQYSPAYNQLVEVEGISFGISELLSFSGEVVHYSMELAIDGGRLLDIDIASITVIEVVEADLEIGLLRKEIFGNKQDDNSQFG